MKMKKYLAKNIRNLAFAAAGIGATLMMTGSPAQAVIFADAAVCVNPYFGYGYLPAGRSASTTLYESAPEGVVIGGTMWSYPEGSTTYTQFDFYKIVDPGGWYAVTGKADSTAPTPGSLLVQQWAWTPTLLRMNTGIVISEGEAAQSSTGCATVRQYF